MSCMDNTKNQFQYYFILINNCSYLIETDIVDVCIRYHLIIWVINSMTDLLKIYLLIFLV